MKQTKIESIDDPRLTAYALGELDGDDALDVEAFLATSEAARNEVAQIRAFAATLGAELEDEPEPRLTDAQRVVIERAVEQAADGASLDEAPSACRRDTASAGRDGGREGRADARPVGGMARVLRLVVPLAAAALVIVLARPYFVGGEDGMAERPALTMHFEDATVAQGESATQLDPAGAQALRQLGYLGGSGVGDDEGSATAFDGPVASHGGTPKGSGRGAMGRGLGAGRASSSTADSTTDAALEEPVFVEEPILLESAPKDEMLGEVDALAAVLPESVPPTPIVGVGGGGRAPGALAGRIVDQARAGSPAAGAVARGSSELIEEMLPPEGPLAAGQGGGGGGNRVDSTSEKLWRGRVDGSVAPARTRASGESYAAVPENDFRVLSESDPLAALSTFGIDVDTASYANVRRFLTRNQAPPPDAVRLEELVNSFRYDDPAPRGDGEDGGHPFAVSVGVASAPWRPEHRLVRVALKAAEVERAERPANNLVFLLDVSGSMQDADKLPLLKASLELLLRELDERDRVAIVTYASGSRVVLPSTSCAERATILAAIGSLQAEGSTHASAGIEEAYRVASQGMLADGNNRVLLATDGDFNVGITDSGSLQTFISDKAKSGIFLTVLGFGTGNLNDSIAELLADKGNGNYAYIDTLNEAHKVLVEELGGTLQTVAKDVKLQVEFNPARVRAYRLLGYENRVLAARDFRDDKKDAGEVGAGHSVVALYEVVPAGVVLPDDVTLRYRQVEEVDESSLVESPELLTVSLRYKLPDGDAAREFAVPLIDEGLGFEQASDDFRFSAAVASFGMILRRSEHRGETDLQRVLEWAAAAKGRDEGGYRAEFVRLVRTAQGIAALR